MLALALVPLTLAGCLGGTLPAGAPDDAPGAAPTPSCPEPCARPIDAGVRWEPSVAANPMDPLHVVASSQDQTPDAATGTGRSWGLSHVTRDGGATWKTVRLPGGLQGDPAHPLHRYAWMDDSAVAFLPDGTLLWSALVVEPGGVAMRGGSGASVVVLRSPDGGLTFPDVTFVAKGEGWRVANGVGPVGGPSAGYAFHDKQWLAIAPDGLALLVWDVVYRGHPACGTPDPTDECTEVVFSTSTDGGRTWTAPGLIADGGIYSGAYPLIRSDGAWVVSYRDTERSEAVVAVSTDQGATWRSSVVDVTTKFPVLAKAPGPEGERLFMAYPQSDEHHDGSQVVTLRWSDDGGLTWSAALALDAPEHEGRTNPAIATAGDGSVVVTYWHVLEEGAELRAVAVRDGRVSEVLVLGVTEGATSETGDYMGVASVADGGMFAVWNARKGEALVIMGARIAVE